MTIKKNITNGKLYVKPFVSQPTNFSENYKINFIK